MFVDVKTMIADKRGKQLLERENFQESLNKRVTGEQILFLFNLSLYHKTHTHTTEEVGG